jgi:hypothetical protein
MRADDGVTISSQHTSTLTPTHRNIAAMLTIWHNRSAHTQTANQNQPKQKKQTLPKPQVWCAILKRHTHTKKNKN